MIIAHAGISEELIGKQNSRVKTFVLYGDITGEKHDDGSPVRKDWALDYKGKAFDCLWTYTCKRSKKSWEHL